MIKRLSLALAGLFAFVQLASAAGTISLSMTQQFDSLGRPLNGGKLYTFAAGTTTPQSAYQDSGLTIPWPNPITLDSAGRIGQLFFADGSIKIRLTNAAGVPQLAADGILVIGASSGGGGGSPVDATTIFQTGDEKIRYGTGTHTGWVRKNGRTIGSATSGATERANADCQALFEYLWDTDANLSVSTGRGATAAADWAANKTLTLPDARGLALAGLDDMGSSARGVFTGVTFSNGGATTLGSALGAARRTLSLAQLPTGITAGGTNSITVSTSGTSLAQTPNSISSLSAAAGGGGVVPLSVSTWSGVASLSGSNSIAVTSNNTGGAAFDSISPYMLITYYLKL